MKQAESYFYAENRNEENSNESKRSYAALSYVEKDFEEILRGSTLSINGKLIRAVTNVNRNDVNCVGTKT